LSVYGPVRVKLLLAFFSTGIGFVSPARAGAAPTRMSSAMGSAASLRAILFPFPSQDRFGGPL
jgi:hypothetical protein